ncbi:MAG: type III pantothenate kinase [Vicingaceae bacterium]|nr:type III pantothenate kinase [Vicingaceae bacterium]
MMILAVDIGNTLVKLAVFEGDKVLKVISKKEVANAEFSTLVSEFNIKKGIISSVSAKNETIELLKNYNFLELSYTTPLPLQIKYKTPQTLGLDRIAAVVAAKKEIFENVLVIDMGTCVTYDFVNDNNEYLGGAISPGFEMRFKALNIFTGKLPLIKFDKDKLMLVGNSTENSIISGVYNGLRNEIQGIINNYLLQYKNLKIVVTGGDRNLFDLEPKNRIFADEFLVLKGLNKILRFNEKK